MIGLSFLAVALLWLALAFYLTVNLPRWLDLKKLIWPLRIVLLSILLVGPFVDEIVGMRQFRALCEERTTPRIASDAATVEWAKVSDSTPQLLKGFVINVEASTVSYTDSATGKVFLAYEYFKTKGGRIAGFALMGGWHSCSAESNQSKYSSEIKAIPAYQKIVNGVQK
jgi:hypothetical protein